MAPDYSDVAYIDESGDDGLARVKPIDPNGSSEWLVLGAVIVSAAVLPWARAIIQQFRNHQRRGIHFSDLNDAKKAVALRLA